jgi:hypothetical protein
MLMEKQDLVDSLLLKLGPAVRLFRYIEKLQTKIFLKNQL